MIIGIHHVGVIVGDLEKSLIFYRDALGLKLLLAPTKISGEELSKGLGVKGAKVKIAMLQAGDDIVELIQYVTPKGKPYDRLPPDIGNKHIAFKVSNIQKVYNELTKKAVKFNTPPIKATKGVMKAWCYLNDPDGTTIELIE